MRILEPPKKLTWEKEFICKRCEAKLLVELFDVQYEVTDTLALAQQYNEDIKGIYFFECPECLTRRVIKDLPTIFEEEVKNR